MKLYRFERDRGRLIDAYGSSGLTIVHLARIEGSAQAVWMYIEPGGTVGWHQAAQQQLFLLVQGEGWVRGGDGPRVPITLGLGCPLGGRRLA